MNRSLDQPKSRVPHPRDWVPHPRRVLVFPARVGSHESQTAPAETIQ
jgi:hypothetical protein